MSSTNKISPSAPTVLYIIGEGRSGSTLLDMLLGQVESFESVGELRFVWSRGKRDNQRCGCGVEYNSCQHWNKIVKRFDQICNDFTHDELAEFAVIGSMNRFPGFFISDKLSSDKNKIRLFP